MQKDAFQMIIWLLLLCVLVSLGRASDIVSNDDYCDDMQNGGDESQTAACSWYAPVSFICEDKSHIQQRVYTSRLGDGVCDCCDCSDEAATIRASVGSGTCQSIGQQLLSEKKGMIAMKNAARLKKAKLVAKAKDELKGTRHHLQLAEKLVPQYESMIEQLQATVTKEEELEAQELRQKIQTSANLFGDNLVVVLEKLSRITMVRWIAAMTLRSREDGAEVVSDACAGLYTINLHSGPSADATEAIVLAMESPEMTDTTSGLYTTLNAASAAEGTPILVNEKALMALGGFEKLQIREDHVQEMITALALERISLQDLKIVLATAIGEAQKKDVMALSLLDARYGRDDEGSTGEDDVEVDIDPNGQASKPKKGDGIKASMPEATSFVDVMMKIDRLLKQVPTSSKRFESIGHTRLEAENARTQLAKAKEDQEKYKKTVSEAEAMKGINFGPEDFLYPLFKKTVSTQDKGYNYRVTPFKDAYQNNNLLGTYEKFTVTHTNAAKAISYAQLKHEGSSIVLAESLQAQIDDATFDSNQKFTLIYTKGAHCFATQSPREMHVELQCANVEIEELSDISEPETCLYFAILKTPLVC